MCGKRGRFKTPNNIPAPFLGLFAHGNNNFKQSCNEFGVFFLPSNVEQLRVNEARNNLKSTMAEPMVENASDSDEEMQVDGESEVDNRYVSWRTCSAREIILEDLILGYLPLDESELSAEEAWEEYRKQDDFKLVPFGQFECLLKDH